MDLKTGDFDSKYNILDTPTPGGIILSAKYKKSFAYHTLRNRLPVIITQIIDSLTKDKDEIAAKYEGEKTREDIKEVVGQLSKLKYQLQTDKNFEKFSGQEPDKDLWNAFLETLDVNFNSFFQSAWLYAECYMYRRIASFFENSPTLSTYDYFFKQKENSLKMDEVVGVAKRLKHTEKDAETFSRLLKLNLWGNKCDLSIIIPTNFDKTENVFDNCEKFDANILVDNSKSVWNCLMSAAAEPSKQVIVDFVLDNAGFEFFTDLILADYMLEKHMASKIRFHVKARPWFVSDVTPSDFYYTFEFLCQHSSDYVSDLGRKWKQYIQDGLFILAPLEYFWTTAFEYYRMREMNLELYNLLGEAHLVLFKGDLNYRKLLGDMNWNTTDDFLTCLRGFQPTNICALRTIKADLVCGLEQGKAEALTSLDPKWMETGEYGVIQFMKK